MATKAIIEIPVDDSDFRRFYELFEEYSARLDEMPETWQRLNDVIGDATDTLTTGTINGKEAMAMAAAQAGVIAEAIRDAVRATNDLGSSASKANKGMDGLKRSAEGVGKAISIASGWIVKLAAIGGLGALFSGFGIGELASSAFNRTRNAGGLGISPGLLTSFEVNAQQFLNRSALEAAANAQLDIKNTPWFRLLGINNAGSRSPSDLAFDELRSAAQAYRKYEARGQAAMFMQTPEWMAYQALGGNINDVRRAAAPGGIEGLNAAQRATNAGIGRFEIPPDVQRDWTKLKITLDDAEQSIETAFIKGLAPITPELSELAKATSDVLTGLLSNKTLPRFLDDVAQGLHGLAQFLEHVDWTKAEAFFTALWPKNFNATGTGGKHGLLNKDDWMNTPGARMTRGAIDWLKNAGKTVYGWTQQPFKEDSLNAIRTVSKKLGIDPLMAIASAMQESGLDQFSKGDYDKHGNPTSFGLYQLHRGGELGNLTEDQAYDPMTNAQTALSVFAQVAKRHPDWSPGQIAAAAQRPADPKGYAKKVNAIYDKLASDMTASVIREVDSDIKHFGKDWMRHLPSDVASFVAQAHLSKSQQSSTDVKSINKALKAVLARRTPKPAQVSITNSTSARVAVSMNAVAVS